MSRNRSVLWLVVLALAPVADAAPSAKPLVVYVHRGGGRVVAADRDDASRFASSVVKFAGLPHADVPAFYGALGEWQQLMTCMRRYYAGLPIDLVDERPAGGDYLMLVVGGRAQDIGYERLWGLSSTRRHRVVERGVGFVFSGAHTAAHTSKPRVQRLCETASHEVGHLLGLPHTEACDDLMTSNNTCVQKAPSYGFRRDNWSKLARAIDTWRARDRSAPEEAATRSAAHPR